MCAAWWSAAARPVVSVGSQQGQASPDNGCSGGAGGGR